MLVSVSDLLGHVRLVMFPVDVAKRRSLGTVVAELHCRKGVLLGGDGKWLSGRRASLCAVCSHAHPIGSVVATFVRNNSVQVRTHVDAPKQIDTYISLHAVF